MAGANYMGGKRNNAKAHFKDANGKTQKGHFMKQRHQLLTQALRDRGSLDNESKKTHQAQKREEISFAHAQRDIHDVRNSIQNPRPRISAVQDLVSTIPACVREDSKRISDSRLLERLDIDDPSGLRATIHRLLDLPDLAGLSGMSFHPSVRKHEDNALDDGNFPRKRQRTASISSERCSVHYDSLGCSPDGPPPQPEEYNCISSDSLEGNGTSGYADAIADGLFLSSPIASSNRGQKIAHFSSDQFSTMLECGTPNDSGFSELSFSDYLGSSAENLTSASKVISDHSSGASNASPFSASSPDKKTRLQYAPRNSIAISSSGSCRAPLLPMAVSKRPTFTPRSILARSALPTYPSSPHLMNEPQCQMSPTTQLSRMDTDNGKLAPKFVSLLEVPDPWRYLDDVLGLHPQPSRTCSDRSPSSTTNLEFDDRAGLGHAATHPVAQSILSQQITDIDDTISDSHVKSGGMATSTMDKPTTRDFGGLGIEGENMVMSSPKKLNRSSPPVELSARDILPMKRHILSTASQVRRSRDPFVVAGTVTSVFAPTTPGTRSPETASPALPCSLSSSSGSRKSYSSSILESDELQHFPNEPELSVSAAVRQMLFHQESPVSQLNVGTMKSQPSSQIPFSLPSKLSPSPTQAGTIPRRVTFGGPDLFRGIEEDEE